MKLGAAFLVGAMCLTIVWSGCQSCQREQTGSPPAAKPAEGKNPMVLMSTSMGDIKIELYEGKAPITVQNFLAYVNAKFFDGTIFHRVTS